MVNLEETFVIRTDDVEFEQALIQFLIDRCDMNKINAAYFHLNGLGAEKVMEIIKE